MRVGAQRQRVVEERAELDLAVAQHVGVRRAPGAILGRKCANTRSRYSAAKLTASRSMPMTSATLAASTRSCARRAVLVGVVVLPVLHEQADDVEALRFSSQRRDRRVDAARTCRRPRVPLARVIIRSRVTRSASGSRRPARQSSSTAAPAGCGAARRAARISSGVSHSARTMPSSSARSRLVRRATSATKAKRR